MRNKKKLSSFTILSLIFLAYLMIIALPGNSGQSLQSREILDRMNRIKSLLSLSAKQKADQAVYAFQYRVFSSDKDMDYYRLASEIVKKHFQNLSSVQIWTGAPNS
jgi:hypothetical protein